MDNLSIRQYLLQGGAWAFTGKILTAFMGVTLSALLARLLPPDDMGAYFLAFNLATFFSIFARMGLENTFLRFISAALIRNQPGLALNIIKKGLILALISTGVVAFLVYFGFGPWANQFIFKSNILDGVIGFVAIWLVLLAFQFLLGEIFRAFQDIHMSVLFGGLLTSVLTVAFIIIYIFAKKHATINQILPWVLAAGMLNVAIAIWLLATKLDTLHGSHNDERIKYLELTSHSWPLLINAVMMYIMAQSSILIVGAFLPDAAIAVYGAASRLVLLTSMTLTIVNTVVPPLIARLHVQNDKKRFEQVLRTTATIAAIPSFIVLIFFISFGSLILDIIFGEFYRTGSSVLTILSLGQAVNVFVGSCGYTLILTGHRSVIMLISMSSAMIALGSSLFFVQNYGTTGVAAAYTLAMIVQQLLMLAFTRYYCGVWTHVSFKELHFLLRTLYRFVSRATSPQ